MEELKGFKTVDEMISEDFWETATNTGVVTILAGLVIFLLSIMKFMAMAVPLVIIIVLNIIVQYRQFKRRKKILREFDEKERTIREETNLNT
jgi:Flp pilus assembly protein TadB